MRDAAQPMAPPLEPLARLTVDVGAALEIGHTGGGRRRLIPIIGGQVQGERLQGRVLPGGVDVQLVRDDGTAEVEAHYAIELLDGTRIYVLNRGLRVASAEDTDRLMRGEPVDPARVYFRCTPRFEAPAGPWRWLSQGVFAGRGVRRPDRVELEIWRLA
jgi:hypothetical protein